MYNWWVGRDWLRRNFVFELATNGLKEVVALQNPIEINGLQGQKMTVRLSVRLHIGAKFESVLSHQDIPKLPSGSFGHLVLGGIVAL